MLCSLILIKRVLGGNGMKDRVYWVYIGVFKKCSIGWLKDNKNF